MNDFKCRIEEFLKSLGDSEQVSQAYFINIERFFNNQLYPYCEKINKTIEDFTVDDMVNFMSQSKLALKIRSFENNCVYVRRYMRWCYDSGYITKEKLDAHFSFIPNIITQIFHDGKYAQAVSSRKYFISTQEFVEFVDTVFGEELSYQIDEIKDVSRFDSQKAILYLLWLGFSPEEIINLTIDDFDAKQKTIADVKITDKDIFSFFCYYKPRTDLLQLRKKGEEYSAIYQDTYHLVKGIHNPCNLITVRNATITAQKRQKMLPENHKFRYISINASTIFYSQLFEKCYRAESELIASHMRVSKKTTESLIKDIVKENIPQSTEVAVSKVLKEYVLYKTIISVD